MLQSLVRKSLGMSVKSSGEEVVKEGAAKILFSGGNEVFYNKVQVLNRDLSIAVISYFSRLKQQQHQTKLQTRQKQLEEEEEDQEKKKHLQEWLQSNATFPGIRIFEALSATGLRSIRYFQQIPNVANILVNDIDAAAVEAIRRNVESNGLDTEKVIPNEGDASLVMYQHRNPTKLFDVVDLDPYGSAAPFLDSAVQAVSNGGLLCVTCTDMAVLSGNHPEVCFAKYRAMPNKGNYLHEMALRIVLSAVESSANRYQRHIVPVLSCSIDFYVRIFVRVYKSPINVKKAMTKLSYVYQCIGCDSFHMQPVGRFNGKTYHGAVGPIVGEKCDQCSRKYKIGGPIWSAPIHSKADVLEIIKDVENSPDGHFPTKDRLHGLLTTVSEEVEDAPLYYTLPGLCKTLHCSTPRMDEMKGALINAGYNVSQSHKVPDAVKTNAPNDVVWDILRCWVKKYPINKKREQNVDTPGYAILSKEPKIEANFSVPSSLKNKTKALRFPQNPEPFWGPKRRACGKKKDSVKEEEPAAKRIKVDTPES